MSVEQMIYTSCKHGLGAGPGFQTQATSAGLPSQSRRELEQLPAYRYPRSLPTHPTRQELQQICPPNYQLTQLSDRSLAVTCSVYAGTDYSGRRGNFLAHSLVLPPGTRIWPIDLTLWDQWQTAVCEDPPRLPALDPAALRFAGGPLDFESLSQFVRRQSDRCAQLAVMLEALLSSRISNRPLVIRDEPQNLIPWVACLTKMLPPHATQPFTFATFVNTPLPGVDIQCTTADSDLTFSADELCHRMFVFDFVDHRFSLVETAADGCAHALATRLRDNPAWFRSFHAFADQFRPAAEVEQLPCLLTCFSLLDHDSSPPFVVREELAAAIAFAGRALNEPDHKPGGESALLGRIADGAAACAERNPASRLGLAEGIASLVPTRYLADEVREPGIQPPGAARAFDRIVARLVDSGRGGTIAPQLLAVAARHEDRAVFVAMVAKLLAHSHALGNHVLAVGIAHALQGVPVPDRQRLRNTLLQHRQHRALILELQYRAAEVNRDVASFLACWLHLYRPLEPQQRRELCPLIATAWRTALPPSRREMARWLFAHPALVADIDRLVSAEIITEMATAVPLDRSDRHVSSLVRRIRRLCRATELPPPVRLPVRDFVEKVRRRRIRSVAQLNEQWNSLACHVDQELGREVVETTLLSLLAMSRVPADHLQVLRWSCNLAETDAVAQQYGRVLESREFARVTPAAAGAFAVVAMSAAGADPELRQLCACADRHFDSWLLALPHKCFEELGRYVWSYQRQLTKDKLREWSARRARAARGRKSWASRVLRWLGRRTASVHATAAGNTVPRNRTQGKS